MRLPGPLAGVLALAVLFSAPAGAQAVSPPHPQFEAATVKPSRNGNSGVRATTGTLTLENVSLRILVSVAYKVRPSQITGGPSWDDSAAFDIQGKAAEAAGTDTMLLMLQALLEDRFKLKVHHETREGPVYELTVAKGGHRLKPSSDCVPFDPNHLPRQTAAGELPVSYCGRLSVTASGLRRNMDAKGVDILPRTGLLTPSITGFLSETLNRTVINKTGLAGAFDFQLQWASQQPASLEQPDAGSAPSIFTAVQEQLGLKLVAATGPVDLVVIDRAEKPSDN